MASTEEALDAFAKSFDELEAAADRATRARAEGSTVDPVEADNHFRAKLQAMQSKRLEAFDAGATTEQVREVARTIVDAWNAKREAAQS